MNLLHYENLQLGYFMFSFSNPLAG